MSKEQNIKSEGEAASAVNALVMPDELTDEQLDTLRHMLGINTPFDSKPQPYRNYYCADKDNEELIELESIGAVKLIEEDELYRWYKCTESGKLAAMRSHKDIRQSKSKRVYHKFLTVSDAIPDLTFKQYLTEDRFEESRAEA